MWTDNEGGTMRRYLAVLAVAAVFAVGCGGGGDDTESAATPGGPVTETEDVQHEVVAQFGQPHTFPDGLVMTFSLPQRYERSADAEYYGDPIKDRVVTRIEVTVDNRTARVIDPSLLISGGATHGEQEISPVGVEHQSEPDVRDAVSQLLPGRSTVFDTLWVVQISGELVIPVYYMYRPATQDDFGAQQIVYFRGLVEPAAGVSPPVVGAVEIDEPYVDPLAGADEGSPPYDDEYNLDPDMNVGPDGVCVATPCGSNGTRPVGPLEGG